MLISHPNYFSTYLKWTKFKKFLSFHQTLKLAFLFTTTSFEHCSCFVCKQNCWELEEFIRIWRNSTLFDIDWSTYFCFACIFRLLLYFVRCIWFSTWFRIIPWIIPAMKTELQTLEVHLSKRGSDANICACLFAMSANRTMIHIEHRYFSLSKTSWNDVLVYVYAHACACVREYFFGYGIEVLLLLCAPVENAFGFDGLTRNIKTEI